jgi:hypothetical protein
MLRLRGVGFYLALLIAGLPLVGCGGSSPTSPSGAGKVVLHGVAVGADGAPTASGGGVTAQAASKDRITVTVQGTSISTTVSTNGTFELEDLPTGSFALVFSINTTVIGTVTITGVPTQGEIQIVVQVTVTTVVLINLEIDDQENDDNASKTCIVEGGKLGRKIELEGNVDSGNSTAFKMKINGERSSGLVDVDASHAQFNCNGDKSSSATTCKDSVKPHAKVHVSGTLMTCTTSAAQVVATEVKVQKAEGGDESDD